MGAANTNVTPIRIGLGGNTIGLKMGVILTGAKAAQNDTWTVIGATKVERADITVIATGASETYTIADNVITLTSATTGACSATIYYK
jgi:hypothetical protein